MLKIPQEFEICRCIDCLDDLEGDEPFGEDCCQWDNGNCSLDKLPCAHTTIRIDWVGEHLD